MRGPFDSGLPCVADGHGLVSVRVRPIAVRRYSDGLIPTTSVNCRATCPMAAVDPDSNFQEIVMTQFLDNPPRHFFFTGKGGVGKTSIACATAVHLARQGKRVLLVSTDPASNIAPSVWCHRGQQDNPDSAGDRPRRAGDRPRRLYCYATPLGCLPADPRITSIARLHPRHNRHSWCMTLRCMS